MHMGQHFWLIEGGFEIHRTARVSIDAVRRMFADTERWVRLQPLVIDIRAEPDPPDYYRITDELRLFGVPFKHTYRARIEPGKEGVNSEVWSRPSIHMCNRISWAADGEHTRIDESVRIEAPRTMLRFTVNTARKAHGEMLDHICAQLERERST